MELLFAAINTICQVPTAIKTGLDLYSQGQKNRRKKKAEKDASRDAESDKNEAQMIAEFQNLQVIHEGFRKFLEDRHNTLEVLSKSQNEELKSVVGMFFELHTLEIQTMTRLINILGLMHLRLLKQQMKGENSQPETLLNQ